MDGAQVSDGSTPSLSAFANATEFRNIVLGAATSPTEAGLTRRPHCGEKPFLNCGYSACNHGIQIDLAALAARLGRDHGAMHDDLVRLFRCQRCAEAGRDQRPVFFTCLPDYQGIQQQESLLLDAPTPCLSGGGYFSDTVRTRKEEENAEASLLFLTNCFIGFFGGCAQDRTVNPLIKSHSAR